MIKTEPCKPPDGWKFWFQWVIASTFSVWFGVMVTFVLWYPTNLAINSVIKVHEDTILGYVKYPALGLTFGTLQWFVLRRYVSWAREWFWMTAVGWAACLPISTYTFYQLVSRISGGEIPSVWFVIIQNSIMAAIIGSAQSLVLRQHVPRSGWWIFATLVSHISVTLLRGTRGLSSIRDYIIFGGIHGIISGLVLIWLMKQSPTISDTQKLETSTA